MKKIISIIFVTLILTIGCAFAPHKPVAVKPELSIIESSVGKDHDIWVNVVDERVDKKLGTRGVGDVGAEITLEENFPSELRDCIADGLGKQGFSPVDTRTPDNRELRVEIRNVEYKLIMGFWSGTLRTECGLKAYCIVGNNRPYEKLYVGEYEKSVQIVQADEANQRYINAAVSNAINALMQDIELMQCIANE